MDRSGAIKTAFVAAVLLTVVLGLGVSVEADPIWEFKFNETGTTCANTGTDPTSPALSMWDGNGYQHAGDMHGADGSGVSGEAGDGSIDFSQLPIPGSYSGPGTNIPNASIGAVEAMTTMTHSYWVKLDSPLPSGTWLNSARIGTLDSSYQHGFTWAFGTEGTPTSNVIRYGIDAAFGSFDITSAMAQDDNGQWFFLALTYDGSLTSNNVNLYIGSDTDCVTLIGTNSANQGALDDGSSAFACHANTNSTGGIDGWGDNYRIDGAVLDLATLETRRLADVGTGDAIPEPGTLLLLGTGIIGALGVLRRRRIP